MLHLTFEKIKWSVYNINELSFVALSGLEPEQTESQILVHYQNYAIRLWLSSSYIILLKQNLIFTIHKTF